MLLTITLALADAPGEGELVISEIHVSAPSGVREWFEVYNPTQTEWDLDGCVLTEGSDGGTTNAHTISDTVLIPGEDFTVLGYRPGSDSSDYCVVEDCSVEPAYYYPSLGFNDSAAETLSITCGGTLVDEAPYDWSEFSGLCAGDSCAINLGQDTMSDTDNDDLDNWCIPPEDEVYLDQVGGDAVGTPGAANVCVAPPPLCEAGEVVISELMADPPNSSDEWIELAGRSGDACNLTGCFLAIGACADTTNPDCISDEKEIEGAIIELAGGEHAVFSRGDLLYVDAAGTYSGLSQSNSEARWLSLICDGLAVDTAPLDWSLFEDRCPEDVSCSVQLSPSSYDPSTNDDLGQWCLGDAEVADDDGNTVRATPGEVNGCAVFDNPAVGEVVFSEVMANPAGLSEWLEVTNTTSGDLELEGCTVQVADDDSVDTTQIGEVALAAGQSLALTSGGCLLGGEGGDTGGVPDCTEGEVPLSGLSLPNTGTRTVSLVCPDASTGLGELEIDTFSYDLDVQGVRQGHSLVFDVASSSDPATDNDPLDAWCEAGFSQEFARGEDDAEDCNYGTPGTGDACVSFDANVKGGPGCRCTTGAGAGGVGLFALLMAMLVRRRR